MRICVILMVRISVCSISERLALSHWPGSNLSCSILRQEGGADVFEVRRWQTDSDESSDEMDKDGESEDSDVIGYHT